MAKVQVTPYSMELFNKDPADEKRRRQTTESSSHCQHQAQGPISNRPQFDCPPVGYRIYRGRRVCLSTRSRSDRRGKYSFHASTPPQGSSGAYKGFILSSFGARAASWTTQISLHQRVSDLPIFPSLAEFCCAKYDKRLGAEGKHQPLSLPEENKLSVCLSSKNTNKINNRTACPLSLTLR